MGVRRRRRGRAPGAAQIGSVIAGLVLAASGALVSAATVRPTLIALPIGDGPRP